MGWAVISKGPLGLYEWLLCTAPCWVKVEAFRLIIRDRDKPLISWWCGVLYTFLATKTAVTILGMEDRGYCSFWVCYIFPRWTAYPAYLLYPLCTTATILNTCSLVCLFKHEANIVKWLQRSYHTEHNINVLGDNPISNSYIHTHLLPV